MTNHTTAETWLRNAPAGCDRGRTVTDEQGRQWGFHTQQGLTQPPNAFFYCVDDDDEPYRANLPPGTYTLNYREGMQLDAEEAWDYLAGGEERRAQGSDGRLWRVLNGLAEFCGHSVRAWVTNIDAGLEAAPYTIAHDEPAMLRCSECVEQQLPSPCPKCKLPEPAETEAVTAHHQGPSTPWCEGRADGLSETADKLRASSAMCAMAADEMTSAAGYMLVLAAERDRLKDAAKRDDPDARTTATEAALANLPPNPQRDSWVRGEMAIGLDEREAEERDRIREAGEAFERRVEAHGMGKLQALGALADALPVDVEAERAISKLAAAKRADREVRPIERSCCREARERVKRQRRELRRLNRCLAEARAPNSYYQRARDAEAERDTWREHNGIARSRIADLEAKLAEAEAGNVEDYAGACEERDAAIAERDAARKDLDAAQARYQARINELEVQRDDALGQLASSAESLLQRGREYDAAIAERDKARERVAELESQVSDLKVAMRDAEELPGMVTQLDNKVADLEAKLAEAERLRDKYHAQSLSRKREIRRLNECFNRNHATGLGRNQLRAKWDNERARAGRISAARVAAEKERDAAIAERDYLKEQVATLERNLNNESEEHDAVTDVLKAERDTAIAERDKLIARIGTLEAQVHQMEGRLPTSNSKLTGVAHRDVETLSAECGRHQRRIAELCKKLQGFEQCDIDRVKAEEERDQLRAELKANAERLDTWRGQSADIRGALGLPHDAEWETVFQAAKEAKRSLTLWQNTYRTHFAPQHDETKHPNECTAAEVDPDTHWGPILEHVRALRSQAITLPTDTTTPLDLAQRAVALMGGRVLRRHVPGGDITAPYYRDHRIGEAGENEICDSGGNTWYMANAHSLALLFCHTETVTLAPEPEPEPERRKLSFGEAVECAVGGVVGETFATSGDWSIEAAMRPGTVSFYEKQPDGTRQRIGLRPAMLAAEWEAVS